MDTTKWMARLTHAKSPAQVLELVNQYVATRDPQTLAAVPAECRPARMSGPEEVTACAYRLSGYHGHDDINRVVQRLSAFFSHASFKLSELERDAEQ
ncbi:MAG TPA: hypothetical protein VM073_05085 [Usitatibacter sp.]|nr:hypothetical protein [Usitatibacter sp.]